jgi:uncharacterized protein (TIGR02145 family)
MKRLLGIFLLMILLLTGLYTCSKEESLPGDQVIGLAFFLTTDDVITITCECAVSGGYIINNTGNWGTLLALGVCWSTTPNPTITDSKTTDKIYLDDPIAFYSTLSGLNCGTTYYVRAYVTNSAGTVYGNVLHFSTKPALIGSVSDIEGNVYKTVQIGTQTWMAENLKTTRYNNGSPLLFGTGGPAGYTGWFNIGDGAYCWYDNVPSSKDTHGAIYNWFAVDYSNLCPAGWHVPTDSEWTTLKDFLGGEVSSAHLLLGTNVFNATFGAALTGWGFGESINGNAWWSSTLVPAGYHQGGYAFLHSLGVSKFTQDWEPLSSGFNVRCLKN